MADVMTTLRPLVGKVTTVPHDEITAERRFEDLGRWGSLAAVRLLSAVEQQYGISLSLSAFMRIETVGELADRIGGLLRVGGASGP
ncbi:acyl carrier protein [Streptomyces olivaceus]|uniref:Acyl carrier protein n=1 Tax=Streptomyces olivaceus TaxID=47716 RepID=A0ABS7WFB7_STROV|nr:acyl carrier protein [Streptomyces olivaceus]MBZ6093501.1 acyl carrier protein [Streptomyces olivaceus]MBZ6100434.1 acyl carrier protein [Streptomyces olivaceus]MBZ6121598.1 acyl carrier protein [Streptomyces olivaceus]MBZ6156334.1 acyl carrier protein [Streptomyces olivaceus]MBZ6302860.1 acyl carrier protein [Streptomyces olivaceus]